MFGALIGNALGNSSTLIANPAVAGRDSCPPETNLQARAARQSLTAPSLQDCMLNCTGAANFAAGLTASAETTSGGYMVQLSVPFTIFAPQFGPYHSASTPWPTWRMNFYRYDYPNGPNVNFSNFELTAWSPTHSGSFHAPHAFGHVLLVG